MKVTLLLLVLAKNVWSDSKILGYELGNITRSLDTTLEIMGKYTTSDTFLLDHSFRKKRKNIDPAENGNMIDISFFRLIVMMCKIEGIWSLIATEWILCALSRTFTRMKLSHLIRAERFDPPLPPKGKKNKNIYTKNAKYLENFFKGYKNTARRFVVIDVFYHSLQYIFLNILSLADLGKHSLYSSSLFQSTDTSPSLSSSSRRITPLDNICHTIFNVIPHYSKIFSQMAIAITNSNGTPYDRILHQEQIPNTLLQACAELKKQNHSSSCPSTEISCSINASFSSDASTYPQSSLLSFTNLRSSLYNPKNSLMPTNPKDPALFSATPNQSQLLHELPSSSYINSPLKKDNSFRPDYQNHASLSLEASRAVSPLFLAHYHYFTEISYLQTFLLDSIDALEEQNTSINSVQALLQIIESVNISLHTLTVFCGPEKLSNLIYYSENENIFTIINTVSTLSEKMMEKGTISQIWSLITGSQKKMRPALIEQLKLLLHLIDYSYDNMNNPAMQVSQLKEKRRIDINLENARKLKMDIKQCVDEIIALLESKSRVRALFNDWDKKKYIVFQQWRNIASLSLSYTNILDTTIDLEVLYRFPLSYFNMAGSLHKQDLFTRDLVEIHERLDRNWQKKEKYYSDKFKLIPKKMTEKKIDRDLRNKLRKEWIIMTETNAYKNLECNDPNVSSEKKKNVSNDKDRCYIDDEERVNEIYIWENEQIRSIGPEKINLETARADVIINAIFLVNLQTMLIPVPTDLMPLEENSNESSDSSVSIPWSPRRLGDNIMAKLIVPFSLLHYTKQFLSLRELNIMNSNLVKSNYNHDDMKGEMQFWLLMNHHPLLISSCFTYVISEQQRDNTFNSSLNYSDTMSLYTSNIDPKYSHPYQQKPFQGVYWWTRNVNVKEIRLQEMDHFIEYLKQRRWYDETVKYYDYRKSYSLIAFPHFSHIEYVKTLSSQYSPYFADVMGNNPMIQLDSLYPKALMALDSALKEDYE